MTGRSFKESLTGWTGFPQLDSRFEPRLTRAAGNSVRKLLVDVEPRTPGRFDLEVLYQRMRLEWHRNHSLEGVHSRDLRQLAWVLFYPPEQDSTRWLGAIPGVVRQYGRWLVRRRRTRSLLVLLHEFLRIYPTDLPTFKEIRLLLRRALKAGDSAPPPSMRKWVQRCPDFRLLEADLGGRFIADLLEQPASPEQVLEEAGLATGLVRSGFLKSGIRIALRKRTTRSGAPPEAWLQKLLALLECEGGLRFDERAVRVEIANGLLGPFIDRAAPAETKEVLQSFFLKHFRDPRLPSGKHGWAGVPEDTRRVVIRWLVERVLDQFFMLLKETAYDHHWRYREAFWRAFLDEDLIDDIWFALGSRAESMLWKMSDDPEVLETTAELYGAQSDQSVLLMRMPGITIAEWSHNGSCHLWLDGAVGAPKLYEREYSAYALRRPYPYPDVPDAHSQRHDGSQHGKWQDQIARWLRENTGIVVHRKKYIPPRLQGNQRSGRSGQYRYRRS
ncbi:MAG: hypothetical protein F4139_03860 [Gemmatimonadetes bacterium]|nr:hypothetical protein [Gemmatimonadota bacterium]MYH52071.1 hypothetical protein [Gemmatimonadota bacterium]MYK65087.1 hypothetical protein [Gemmatimonadota bacterium]